LKVKFVDDYPEFNVLNTKNAKGALKSIQCWTIRMKTRIKYVKRSTYFIENWNGSIKH